MKRRIALIGLGSFGRRMLDELLELDVELIIIDRQEEVIDTYKDRVAEAYVMDVNNEALLEKMIHHHLDYAIVDLGEHLEAAILVTHHLHSIKAGKIIARAQSERQGGILRIIGADEIVYPPRDAVRAILPRLFSSRLQQFLRVGSGIGMAEVRVPPRFYGKPLVELRLRQSAGINVVAIKNGEEGDYFFFAPDYTFTEGDVVLVVGSDEDIAVFAGLPKKILRQAG